MASQLGRIFKQLAAHWGILPLHVLLQTECGTTAVRRTSFKYLAAGGAGGRLKVTLPMAAQRLETGEGFTTSLTVEGHVGLNVCGELGLGCEGCAAHGAEFGRGRVGQGFSIVDSVVVLIGSLGWIILEEDRFLIN